MTKDPIPERITDADNFVTRRCAGRFTISRELIANEPMAVKSLLSMVIVFRAECSYLNDAIEYLAFSPAFEATDDGSAPKDYMVFVDERNGVKMLDFHTVS